MAELFQSVYPFTTECISGYMKYLNVAGKDVLTVGSSCDQAYNAILHDCGSVTIMDINPNTKSFIEIKKDYLLNSKTRKQFYTGIVNDKQLPYTDKEIFGFRALEHMDEYMAREGSFRNLQQKVLKKDINFIHGNIFDMDKVLVDKKYGSIILSNVLQYLDSFIKGNSREVILENFNMFIKHLEDNGIIQLFYLYGKMTGASFTRYDIAVALEDYVLKAIDVDRDQVLIYKKTI